MGDESEALQAMEDGYEGCIHTCRKCGTGSLRWNEGPPWELVDSLGSAHACVKNKKPARDAKETNHGG